MVNNNLNLSEDFLLQVLVNQANQNNNHTRISADIICHSYGKLSYMIDYQAGKTLMQFNTHNKE